MRSSTDIRPIEVFDIRFEKGGMGDSIARLPAVRYIIDSAPHIKSFRLFVQDYFVETAAMLLNSHKVTVFGLAQMQQELTERPSTHAAWTASEHHTTLKTHLTDHAFHVLADCQPLDPSVKSYLQFSALPEYEGLPEKYVVITTGFTAPVREWMPEEVNKVTDWLLLRDITPVFLGKQESNFLGTNKTDAWFREEIRYDKGINLIDKTTIPEAAAIMAKALAVCGVDNGLLHLAACVDANILSAYTTVHPIHRIPYRPSSHVKATYVITPDSTCTFCQTKMSNVYGNDFRLCYYNDYKCVKGIKGEQFTNILEAILYDKF